MCSGGNSNPSLSILEETEILLAKLDSFGKVAGEVVVSDEVVDGKVKFDGKVEENVKAKVAGKVEVVRKAYEPLEIEETELLNSYLTVTENIIFML